MVFLWACNSVAVKITVRDLPPLWAALLRFGAAFPFVFLFIKWRTKSLAVSVKEFFFISILGISLFLQIFLFNWGSQHTTGSRIALFIFSYPILVPFIAPLFIKEEKISTRSVIGCFIALIGLLIPLRTGLMETGSTIKGDVAELLSCLILSFQTVYNKRLTLHIDKWKIFFWRTVVSITLFLIFAPMFEDFRWSAVELDAWLSLTFQILVISVGCFLSYQYILSRHNSSDFSVFFFATPLCGMVMNVLLLHEPFDIDLLFGCLLVGIGIVVVHSRKKGSQF